MTRFFDFVEVVQILVISRDCLLVYVVEATTDRLEAARCYHSSVVHHSL